MKVYWKTVTPELAAQWLKKNTRNRPVHSPDVAYLATQMQTEWSETGESIKFDKYGKLIDGQHRLLACIEAGVPFRTLVVEGLEPASFNKLDQGKKRTLADAFGRDKKPNSTRLAAAVRKLLYIEKFGTIDNTGQRLSIDDGYECLKRHPQIAGCLELVRSWNSPYRIVDDSTLAVYVYWTSRKHGEKAIEFWRQVATGEDLAAKSPAHALHARLVNDKTSAIYSRRTRGTHALCVKAFNAFVKGKSMSRIYFDVAKEELPVFDA